jgi:hypothetical protein
MKQRLSYFYGIVYFNLSGIDAIKIIIKLRNSHEADFIPEILKKNEKKLVLIFNYINDVISTSAYAVMESCYI